MPRYDTNGNPFQVQGLEDLTPLRDQIKDLERQRDAIRIAPNRGRFGRGNRTNRMNQMRERDALQAKIDKLKATLGEKKDENSAMEQLGWDAIAETSASDQIMRSEAARKKRQEGLFSAAETLAALGGGGVTGGSAGATGGVTPGAGMLTGGPSARSAYPGNS